MCSDISVRCEQINIEDVVLVNTLKHSWMDARTGYSPLERLLLLLLPRLLSFIRIGVSLTGQLGGGARLFLKRFLAGQPACSQQPQHLHLLARSLARSGGREGGPDCCSGATDCLSACPTLAGPPPHPFAALSIEREKSERETQKQALRRRPHQAQARRGRRSAVRRESSYSVALSSK
jgi:hypothetical protein